MMEMLLDTGNAKGAAAALAKGRCRLAWWLHRDGVDTSKARGPGRGMCRVAALKVTECAALP